MSGEIKASPAQLDASAEVIEQNATLIARELQTVNEALTTLRRTFLGQRAESFFKQHETALQEMTEATEVIRAFSSELHQVAQRLRAADQA